MAMDATQLADEITEAMGFKDEFGATLPASSEIVGWAKGLLEGIKAGTASFGGTPGPHTISGIVGATMAAAIQGYAGYPSVSLELTNYCGAVASYLMTSSIVTYAGGPVPPASPDHFLEGTISGLDGDAMASMVALQVSFLPPGTSDELKAKCGAITDHIMDNAEVESGVIS